MWTARNSVSQDTKGLPSLTTLPPSPRIFDPPFIMSTICWKKILQKILISNSFTYFWNYVDGIYFILQKILMKKHVLFLFLAIVSISTMAFIKSNKSSECKYGRCAWIKSDNTQCYNCRQKGSIYCYTHRQ